MFYREVTAAPRVGTQQLKPLIWIKENLVSVKGNCLYIITVNENAHPWIFSKKEEKQRRTI